VASWPSFRVARSLRIHSDMLVARALENSQLVHGETHVSYGTGHLNQSRRDRAAKDTIGCYLHLPQLAGESVSASCLPPASGKACHVAGPAEAGLRRGRPSSTWYVATPPLSARATPEVSSIQNLTIVKSRSGLSSEKRVNRVRFQSDRSHGRPFASSHLSK
jgi:hypothetical protein